jgi:hypothetical protein
MQNGVVHQGDSLMKNVFAVLCLFAVMVPSHLAAQVNP